MKKIAWMLCLVAALMFAAACGSKNDTETTTQTTEQETVTKEAETESAKEETTAAQTTTKAEETTQETTTEATPVEETTNEPAEETTTEAEKAASFYEGEYNDDEMNEPALEIVEGADGSFSVSYSIYRTLSVTDGEGTLTADGLEVTSEETNTKVLITLDGDKATLTFLENFGEIVAKGTAYGYTKTSDTPNPEKIQ